MTPGPTAVVRPQVVALYRAGMRPREIAKALGLSLECTYSHIKLARVAGELPTTGIKRGMVYRERSAADLDIDDEVVTVVARCRRCHLAEPHECTADIYHYAGLQSRDAE